MSRPRIGADDGKMRRCSKCAQWFEREKHFYKQPKIARAPLDYSSNCKKCILEYHYNYRQNGRRKLDSGFTSAQGKELIARQPYCTICEGTKRLVLDHCHKS